MENLVHIRNILCVLMIIWDNITTITVDTLNITSYNCRGAMNNAKYIQYLMGESDVLCLQEHLLSENNISFLSTMDQSYKCFARYSSYVNQRGSLISKGGVAILWKSDINCVVNKLENVGNDRIIVIQISQPNSRPIYVINAYMPSGNHTYEQYHECIVTLREIYGCFFNCGDIIIAGDMNTSVSQGSRSYINTGHDNRKIVTVTEFLQSTNQYSVITDSNCTGPIGTYYPFNSDVYSQIDHIVINRDMTPRVKTCKVHDDHVFNASDHLPISLAISTDIPRISVNTRSIYKWDRADTELYERILTDNLNNKSMCIDIPLSTAVDIDNYYNRLIVCMVDAADKSIPKTEFRKHVRPFWTPELKVLHIKQKQLRAVWIHDGKPRGMQDASYTNYKNAKRVFAKQFKSDYMKYEQDQFQKLASDMEMDSRQFWKFINSQ